MKLGQTRTDGEAPRAESPGREDAVWLSLMSGTLFVLLLPASSYIAARPIIGDEWGLNNTQAGAVFSAYLVGYVVASLFVVPLTDRLRPSHILTASAVVSVAAHLLFPLVAHGPVMAIILRAVAGLGLVGVYMAGLRVVAERFSGGGRGAAIGLFVTAQYAANAGSLAITGALMTRFEWREAYLMVSIVSLAGLPVAYALLRGYGTPVFGDSSGRLDVSVLRSAPIRYLIFGYSVHALTLFSVRVWLPAFLLAALLTEAVDPGVAAAKAATIGGLALMVGSVGPVMGGAISDRWGRTKSATAILTLSAACSILVGWTADIPLAAIVALGVVYGWAIAADSAVYSTGITEAAAPAQLGSAMAMQAFLGLMGGVAGPVAFGALLDLSHGDYQWQVSFSTMGVLAVAAIIGMQRLRALPQSRLLAKGRG